MQQPQQVEIRIGSRLVGDDHPAYFIAEIGINANGVVANALKLIDVCAAAGWDAVKFQKRTIGAVYTAEELAKPRESPFGTTNGDLKRGLEFGRADYEVIDAHCRSRGIRWFASCWDPDSVDFIAEFDVPAFKLASASVVDEQLVRRTALACGGDRVLLASTGMCSDDDVARLVGWLHDYSAPKVLLHSVSTYPTDNENLNLVAIRALRERYGFVVGYSGHERGLATTVAARLLGANVIERHVTLDRTMWGSDQAASLEPPGIVRVVRDIRAVESAMGNGVKRMMPGEAAIAAKLRRGRDRLVP